MQVGYVDQLLPTNSYEQLDFEARGTAGVAYASQAGQSA